MASGKNRLTRYLSVVWDRDAARRMQEEADAAFEKMARSGGDEFEGAMKEGGRKAARALTTHLTQEYRVRMARARLQLAEGTIDEKAFEREGRDAAEAFNRGLTGGIRRLRAQGNITDLQLAQLTGRFKRVPGGTDGGVFGRLGGLFGGLGGFAAPLAAGFSAYTVIDQLGKAADAADRFEASARRLEGTAKLTGQSLAFLQQTANQAREEFNLSVPVANEFTSELLKLTSKAGQLERTSDAIRAFLDLGAAQGLGAQETLTAVGQAILGIDEGTDKLFQKNPSAIYAEFAARIGKTAAALTEMEKAQALLDAGLRAGDRVRGSYLDYLDSAAGKQERANNALEEARARFGEAFAPIRIAGLEAMAAGFERLADSVETISDNADGVERATKAFRDLLGESVGLTAEIIDLFVDFNLFMAGISDQPWWNRGEGGSPAAGIDSSRSGSVTLRDQLGPEAERIAERMRQIEAERLELDQERRKIRELEAKAAREAEEARRRELAALLEGAQLRILTRDEMSRLLDIADENRRKLEDQNLALTDRLQLTKELQQIENTLIGGRPEAELAGLSTLVPGAGQKPPNLAKILPDDRISGENVWERYIEIVGRAQEVSQDAAYEMASAFQDAFSRMMEDGATLGNFFEALGRGLAGSILGGLAQVAQGKAAENFALAIEAGAKALLYKDPAAAASVPEFLAAGAAWSALAGLAGAARGAITGGAGAIPPSTRDAGLSRSEQTEVRGTEVHIYIDPLDPHSDRYQRNVYAAQRFARDRFGDNAEVFVHPAGVQ